MPTNVEIVRAALEAFGRGDIPALLAMCDENVAVRLRGNKTIPFAGDWTGKASVTEYFRIVGATFDVLKWEPQRDIASGDRVAAFGSMDVKARATGQLIVGSDWALDFTVASGKITGWQVYMDTGALEKALAAASKAAV